MVNDDKTLNVENADVPVVSVFDDLLNFDFVLKADFQTEKTSKFLSSVLAYFGREFLDAKKNEIPYALGLAFRKQEIFLGLFESHAFGDQSKNDDDDDDDDREYLDLGFKGIDDVKLLERVDLWLDRIHFLISIPIERNDDLKRDCVALLPKTVSSHFAKNNPLLAFVNDLLNNRKASISLPFPFFDKGDFAVNHVFCKNLGGAVLSYLDYVQRNSFTSCLNTRIYQQLSLKDRKELRSLVYRANKCCATLGKKEDDLDRLEFVMLSKDGRVVGVSNDNVFQGVGSSDNALFPDIAKYLQKDYVLMHRHVANLFTDTMSANDDNAVMYRCVVDKKLMPILDRYVPNLEIQYLLDEDASFHSVDLLFDLNLYLAMPLQCFKFPYDESSQIVLKREKDWYYQNISENAIDCIRELLLECVNGSALPLLILDDVMSLFANLYLIIDEKKNPNGLLDWSFSLVSAKAEDLDTIDSKIQSGDHTSILLSKECLGNDARFSFPDTLKNRVFSVKNLYDVLFSPLDEDMNLLVQVPSISTPVDAPNYRRSKANVLKIIYFDDSGKNIGLNFSLVRFGKKDI